MPVGSEDWKTKQLRPDVKLTKAQADDLACYGPVLQAGALPLLNLAGLRCGAAETGAVPQRRPSGNSKGERISPFAFLA
jgi:hypothetical protein